MTLPTNQFRPNPITCWVNTTVIAPITDYAQDHDLPIGTVARIALSGVMANDVLRNLVIAEATSVLRVPMHKMIGAMVDDETQQAIVAASQQNGVKRAAVARAALVVGAKHLADFSLELESVRKTRHAAHERSRERMIKMVNRFQGQVVA